jgi:CO/xanthine dehydrogenase FAD-binding subunit
MSNRPREYHRPTDWAHVLALLRRKHVRTAALTMGPRVAVDPWREVEALVDLSRLDLAYIREEEGLIRIGALTPLQDLVESAELQSVANGLLSEAAQYTAHYGLRQLATVGGALTAREGPPEVRLALLALAAKIVIQGVERYDIPLSGWEQLLPGEILIEVNFDAPPAQTGAALARVARTPRDEAIVAVAVVIEAEHGAPRRVRARVGPHPWQGVTVERMPESQATPTEVLQTALQAIETEMSAHSDFRGSAEYRQEITVVLARRALEEAWRRVMART